ncbi:endonuclease III [Lachnobacterium bovis]|uniref:Endonuclease III n=1 Tax=Lachnobacterium bovis DSM 14045 TaxID=1122142 RepID=A0A1H3KAZ6_9FIRM|nr:endonuclease III [Lachnobacterium bovis]SDY49089.1 DNA-(apurinic or apyrimidinic site) lyase /endonuclease III [Lachnobacterium bovis DSM 14045]
MLNRDDEIINRFNKQYGTKLYCYLKYSTPYELLFSTILSAQCTDERVNQVTKNLYKKYDSLEAFAKADVDELAKDIYSLGFYRAKSKNLVACAKVLLEKYNGDLPKSLEELVALPGVGRKTANVIRGNLFNDPSIVVDTHVKRISKRLGFTKETDPLKVEMDLMKKLPKEQWILWNLHLITFGRTVCFAKKPMCKECFLNDLCNSKDKVV